MTETTEEDQKLIVLARAARTRAYAPHTAIAEGAAVRDLDGRTYSGATVENADADLTTSALRAAVAAAASSGARDFEAAALVTEGTVTDADLAILRELTAGVPVLVLGPDGQVREVRST